MPSWWCLTSMSSSSRQGAGLFDPTYDEERAGPSACPLSLNPPDTPGTRRPRARLRRLDALDRLHGLHVARLKGLDDPRSSAPSVAFQVSQSAIRSLSSWPSPTAPSSCQSSLLLRTLTPFLLLWIAVGPAPIAHRPDRLEPSPLERRPDGPVGDRPDADLLRFEATEPERPPGPPGEDLHVLDHIVPARLGPPRPLQRLPTRVPGPARTSPSRSGRARGPSPA